MRHNIHITYIPREPNGWNGTASTSGVSYTAPWYVASMPALQIYASASSYEDSLTALLILASASNIN